MSEEIEKLWGYIDTLEIVIKTQGKLIKELRIDLETVKSLVRDDSHNITRNAKIIRLDQIAREKMEQRIKKIETIQKRNHFT